MGNTPKLNRSSMAEIMREKQMIVEQNPGDGYEIGMCLSHKKNGAYCRGWPVAGAQRCVFHGGKMGVAIRVGRYSQHLSGRLKDRYNEFLQDTQIYSLRSEVALLRSLVMELQDRMREQPDLSHKATLETISSINDIIKNITSSIKAVYDIKGTVITIEALALLINQITGTINKTIAVCPHCDKPLDILAQDLYYKLQNISLPTSHWQEINEGYIADHVKRKLSAPKGGNVNHGNQEDTEDSESEACQDAGGIAGLDIEAAPSE